MSDCSSDVCSSDLTLDILGSFDGLRVSGLRITPVAGTLTFDIASGGIFNLGANNANNMDDPNVSTFNAQAPAQFRYVTQNSVVDEIGRAHVCTPVTNAHLVCRLLLDKKQPNTHQHIMILTNLTNNTH